MQTGTHNSSCQVYPIPQPAVKATAARTLLWLRRLRISRLCLLSYFRCHSSSLDDWLWSFPCWTGHGGMGGFSPADSRLEPQKHIMMMLRLTAMISGGKIELEEADMRRRSLRRMTEIVKFEVLRSWNRWSRSDVQSCISHALYVELPKYSNAIRLARAKNRHTRGWPRCGLYASVGDWGPKLLHMAMPWPICQTLSRRNRCLDNYMC